MSALAFADHPLQLWDDEPRERGAEGAASPHAAAAPHGHAAASPHAHAAASRRTAASPTLADVLASAWDGLAARATVSCPVCHGELEPRPGGGRCRTCGTTLS